MDEDKALILKTISTAAASKKMENYIKTLF